MDARVQSEQLEQRRLEAGRLLRAGYKQIKVARTLWLGKSTVSDWAKRLEQGGLRALHARGLRGRPASLTPLDRARLRRLLLKGALAAGFATELWTLPRVAELVRREFQVKLSEPQIWRVLRAMGFSPQRPAKRAWERDEAAIRRWKTKRWPRVKKLQNPAAGDRFCRRVGTLGTLHARTQPGPARADSGAPVSLQLETALGHCRHQPRALLLPAAPRQHPGARTGCLSQGA